MLYAQIFQPTSESWEAYVRRALHLILRRSEDYFGHLK